MVGLARAEGRGRYDGGDGFSEHDNVVLMTLPEEARCCCAGWGCLLGCREKGGERADEEQRGDRCDDRLGGCRHVLAVGAPSTIDQTAAALRWVSVIKNKNLSAIKNSLHSLIIKKDLAEKECE